ncbi:hypothetical protein DEU29_11539 [Idiomarina aquatica]|uniref:Uncharacterized protein n=1 Tax=Idiomarina aquatica TaxID=1327752 RepID=A0A4R6P0S1_9GAMM|nr:hypothetical protein DEU29_11539 [Idiomarina aquatica]
MKISNAIIFLSSVITIIVTTTMFQIFVPMINDGGECGPSEYYPYMEVCDSLIGFHIPTWWSITSETHMPVSIFFGLLCGSIVAVYLLLKSQKPSQLNKDNS